MCKGIALPAAGAINQSMGGAATASPLDAAGALYWNPATIGQLPSSEMEIGIGMALPTGTLSSTLPANSYGPGFPPVDLAGDIRLSRRVAYSHDRICPSDI